MISNEKKFKILNFELIKYYKIIIYTCVPSTRSLSSKYEGKYKKMNYII